MIPDFSSLNTRQPKDDAILKFGSIKGDWEQDAKKLAWKKSDLYDDKYM